MGGRGRPSSVASRVGDAGAGAPIGAGAQSARSLKGRGRVARMWLGRGRVHWRRGTKRHVAHSGRRRGRAHWRNG
eukprot:941359-Pyramimonas_sp.AAC.1